VQPTWEPCGASGRKKPEVSACYADTRRYPIRGGRFRQHGGYCAAEWPRSNRHAAANSRASPDSCRGSGCKVSRPHYSDYDEARDPNRATSK